MKKLHFIFRDYNNDPITEVWTDRKGNVSFKNYKYEDRPILTAFMRIEHPTYQDVQDFFERRSFPRDRSDIKEILRCLNMHKYDPEKLCRRFEGRTAQDNRWIEFL